MLIFASFLIDLFLMKGEYIRYRPSMVAAISLELSLRFYSQKPAQGSFEREIHELRMVMRSQRFSPGDVDVCRTLIQRYLMWELAVPNKYLKKKYLRSVANIYLIEPIIENQ